MKTPVTVALLTLIFFLSLNSAVSTGPHNMLQKCCSNVIRTRIPKERLGSVYQSDCKVKAIIVKTVSEREICLDAKWKWAQNLLAKFNSSTVKGKPN